MLNPETFELISEIPWVGANSVTFSPDGQHLVCGNWNGPIKVWSLSKDHTPVGSDMTLIGHSTTVSQLRFTPDGSLVSTGRNKVIVWGNLENQSNVLAEHGEVICLRVKMCSDNTTSVSIGEAGTIIVSNLVTGKQIQAFHTTPRVMNQANPMFPDVSPSPVGPTLAITKGDSVELIDTNTGKQINRLAGNGTGLFDVEFSPDGNTVAYRDSEWRLRLWNLKTGYVSPKEGVVFSGGINFVASIKYSPDGKRLAVPSGEEVVCVDANTLDVLFRCQGHTDRVCNLAFSADGSLMATGSRDSTMRLWDAETGNLIHTFPTHGTYVRSVAFSPDGKMLASGSDGQVKLWNLNTREETITLAEFLPVVLDLSFSIDGQTLVASSFDGTVRYWRAPRD